MLSSSFVGEIDYSWTEGRILLHFLKGAEPLLNSVVCFCDRQQ